MENLIKIQHKEDIPAEFQDTPVGTLLEYHNLGRTHDKHEQASLLVGMCMDNRKKLNIPVNFAFIMRTGGANLRYHEFQVSYALSVGKLKHIALIGHNHCGMSGLYNRRDEFINGLVEVAGWGKEQAAAHFKDFSPMFEVGDEAGFILSESHRLRQRYPGISVAPLIYILEDQMIYYIKEH